MLNKLKSYYEVNRKKFEYILGKLDLAILILYGFFVFEAFLRSTTFTINWHPYYHMSLKVILILLVLGKSLLKFTDNIPLYMILGICSIGFLLAYLQGNHGILLELILFTVAFVDIDYKKLITIFLTAVGISLFIIILGSQTDILNNLIYVTYSRTPRYSFGINYPTDFASYILFLCLSWGFLRKNKISFVELGLMLALSYLIYRYCDARTSIICMIIFLGAMLIYKLIHICSRKKQPCNGLISRLFSLLLCLSVPICALFALLSAYLYSPESKSLVKLNTLLSNRLHIGNSYFKTSEIKIFGQHIDMGGNGGFTFPWLNYSSVGKSGYNFIDSSYLSILFRYGLFVFICVIILFTLTSFVARKHHDYVTLIIIAIIALHSIMEHHMLDFNYNPFMFLLISSYYGKHISKHKSDMTTSEEIAQEEVSA